MRFRGRQSFEINEGEIHAVPPIHSNIAIPARRRSVRGACLRCTRDARETAAPVYFEVADGSHPHDVAAAPTPGGPVYFTAQRTGKLGILVAKTGKIEEVPLGQGSAPHGVIVRRRAVDHRQRAERDRARRP